MPITKEMIRKAQAASERALYAERPILAANRAYWKKFLAARRAEHKEGLELARRFAALLK